MTFPTNLEFMQRRDASGVLRGWIQYFRTNLTPPVWPIHFIWDEALQQWRLDVDATLFTKPIGAGGSVDLSNYYDKTEIDALLAAATGTDLSAYVTLVALGNTLADYYNKVEVDQLLQDQYDTLFQAINAALSSITVDLSNYYNRPEVDALLAALPAPDLSNYYNRPEVDALLAALPAPDLSNYYDRPEIDALLRALEGSVITQIVSQLYTKPEIDALLAAVTGVDLSSYYDKDEIEALALKPIADLTSLLATDYYKRPEVDALLAALSGVDLSEYAKRIAYENFFARGITGNEFFIYDMPSSDYLGAEGLGWQVGINNKPGYGKGRPGIVQVQFSAGSPTHYPSLAPGAANRYDVLLLLSDIATQQDLVDGTASRLVDAALLKGAITQLGQYVEDKFATSDQGAGFAQPGWVYTLVAVHGLNGATETTYGWRPPLPGGGAVDLSEYVKKISRENFYGRGITGNEFFVYEVPANSYPGAEGLGWQIGISASNGAVSPGRLGALQVEFSAGSPTHYPPVAPGVANRYEIFAFLSDLTAYAKLRDTSQSLAALTANTRLLELRAYDNDPSETHTVSVGYSTQLDRQWVAITNRYGSRFLATHEDLFETLDVVIQWFVDAGLPAPTLPARRVAAAALDALQQPHLLDDPAAERSEPVLARLLQLEPELQNSDQWPLLQQQLSDAIATKEAGTLEALSGWIEASRTPQVRPAPPVTQEQLNEALAALGTTTAAEVALRLEDDAATDQLLPAQQWADLTMASQRQVLGSWQLDGPLITAPQDGEYLIDLRGLLAPALTSSELLLRVCGPAGLFSADSVIATPLGGALNLSAVVALAAGDSLRLQAHAEGAGVKVLGGTLSASIRLLGRAPQRRVMTPPAGSVWGEPLSDLQGSSERSITITVPAGTLTSTTALQKDVTVSSSGGASAALAAGSGIVRIGSQVGRLFEVSGRLDRAQVARLEVAANGPAYENMIGVNPALNSAIAGINYAQRPAAITAKATSTRSDFQTPQSGCWGNPRTIYVSTSSAELRVLAAGTSGSGGQITLRDITPAAHIGATITFTGQPMLLPASEGELQVPPGAEPSRRLAQCDIPQLHGVDYTNRGGQQFTLNALPNGIYRMAGEFTVAGAHANCGWRLGWDTSILYRDSYIPSTRQLNADGTVTYRFAWLYRAGSGDGARVGLYFTAAPGSGNAGKEVTITGSTTFRRVMEPETIELVLPLAAMQPIGGSYGRMAFKVRDGQQWDNSTPELTAPLMMISTGSLTGLDAHNIWGSNWASTWPQSTACDRVSVAPLFGNIPGGTAPGQVQWKAVMEATTNRAISGARITQRVVAGSTNPSTVAFSDVTAAGQTDFSSRIEFDLRPPDGGMLSNFLVFDLQSAAANALLLDGVVRFIGRINPTPLP